MTDKQTVDKLGSQFHSRMRRIHERVMPDAKKKTNILVLVVLKHSLPFFRVIIGCLKAKTNSILRELTIRSRKKRSSKKLSARIFLLALLILSYN